MSTFFGHKIMIKAVDSYPTLPAYLWIILGRSKKYGRQLEASRWIQLMLATNEVCWAAELIRRKLIVSVRERLKKYIPQLEPLLPLIIAITITIEPLIIYYYNYSVFFPKLDSRKISTGKHKTGVLF